MRQILVSPLTPSPATWVYYKGSAGDRLKVLQRKVSSLTPSLSFCRCFLGGYEVLLKYAVLIFEQTRKYVVLIFEKTKQLQFICSNICFLFGQIRPRKMEVLHCRVYLQCRLLEQLVCMVARGGRSWAILNDHRRSEIIMGCFGPYLTISVHQG